MGKNKPDPFDPNTWDLEPPIRKIYSSSRHCDDYAIVSDEDYQWAIRWCWHINEPHRNRKGKKRYFSRQTGNGMRAGVKLQLHIEIMKRTGIEPPDLFHTIVDHIDSNEWNCCRSNLRWATPRMNRVNINKRVAYEGHLI